MKKLLTIILTAACVLSLDACGSSSSSKSSSEPAADASSAADASLADASSTEASSNAASSTVASSDAASSTVASSNAASSTDEAASTGSTSAETSVLTTITDGVLTMGTNAAFPPYEYYEGETVVGIDAEVAGAIAEALGLKLEIVDMDFSSIITSVQTGKIDIGAAGMTVTEERLKNVNFSDSYSTGVQVIIVPEDSKIKSVDDLEGAQIGRAHV